MLVDLAYSMPLLVRGLLTVTALPGLPDGGGTLGVGAVLCGVASGLGRTSASCGRLEMVGVVDDVALVVEVVAVGVVFVGLVHSQTPISTAMTMVTERMATTTLRGPSSVTRRHPRVDPKADQAEQQGHHPRTSPITL